MTPHEESKKVDAVKLEIEKVSMRASAAVGLVAVVLLLMVHSSSGIYQIGAFFFVIMVASQVAISIAINRVQKKESEIGLRNTHWINSSSSE